MLEIFIILFIQTVALIYCNREGLTSLKFFILLNVLSTIVLPQTNNDNIYNVSDVRNIIYPFILQAIIIMYYKFGIEATQRVLKYVFLSIVFFLTIQYCSITFEVVNPQDELLMYYKSVIEATLTKFVTFFSVFIFSSHILVLLLNKFKNDNVKGILVALITTNIIDSVLFYILYQLDSTSSALSIMSTMLIKSAITVLLIIFNLDFFKIPNK